MVIIVTAVVLFGGGYFDPIRVEAGSNVYRFVSKGDKYYTSADTYVTAAMLRAIVNGAKKVGGRVRYLAA